MIENEKVEEIMFELEERKKRKTPWKGNTRPFAQAEPIPIFSIGLK